MKKQPESPLKPSQKLLKQKKPKDADLGPFLGEAKKAYPKEFIPEAKRLLKLPEKNEISGFIDDLILISADYLSLISANQDRVNLTEQKRVLRSYKNALKETHRLYKEVQSHRGTRAKYNEAVKLAYKGNKTAGINQMFEPYCTKDGLAPELFSTFLEKLISAATTAPTLKLGTEKTSLKSEFIARWIARVALIWPEESPVPVALGKYLREIKGYKSPSIVILHKLLSRVDKSVKIKDIEYALRRRTKEKLDKNPSAIFLK